MRPIDGDELMERLQSRFYAHNLKCDFDRCARSVILSCMEEVRRSSTICEPPNDPLTPEELREMGGEPVWVATGRLHEWCIVHSCHSDDVTGGGVIMTRRTAEKRIYQYANYGKTWLAYRRRPEGGAA